MKLYSWVPTQTQPIGASWITEKIQLNYIFNFIDTVKIDSAGKFHLKTFELTKPALVTLRAEEFFIDFYTAQGYNRDVTTDMSNFKTFFEQWQIKGLGSAPNQYLRKKDSIITASTDTTNWYDLRGMHLVNFIHKDERRQDSLFSLVFAEKLKRDKLFDDFATIAHYEIKCCPSYTLIFC